MDRASEKHDVLVADADGERVSAATLAHDERGPRAPCATPVRLGVERVAIERRDGLLVAAHAEDLAPTRVALADPLRAELERFRPGATVVFRDSDSPIAPAFPERFPGPADARGPGEQRHAAFPARHRHRAPKTPAALPAKPRSAPAARAGEAETEARRAIVLAHAAAPRPIAAKITALTTEIAHRIHAHPDGHVFPSPLRDPHSVVCAAAPPSEIGDRRARYPTAEALAADAGMTPVAVQSANRKVAAFGYGRDKRPRDATSTPADATRHRHPWAAARYAAARARRQDHPRAIPTLPRARGRVPRRRRQHHTAYDPARHRGPQQHPAVTTAHPSRPRLAIAATQPMAGAAVTHRAAHRAQHAAPDRQPPTATHQER